ncbi:MAG: DUF5990 family protein [Gemmatimonadota bacterium]
MTTPTRRIRIILLSPPARVRWALQEGRDHLVPPVRATADAVILESRISIGPRAADGTRPCRGAAVQGKPGARFVYATSGTYAGDYATGTGRRAKVPLPDLSPALAAAWDAAPDHVLEARIAGSAKDGGAAAASVPLLDGGWRLVQPDSA